MPNRKPDKNLRILLLLMLKKYCIPPSIAIGTHNRTPNLTWIGSLFIPASNEPSSRACADIWRMPRGSNTQPLGAGYLTAPIKFKMPITRKARKTPEHLQQRGKAFPKNLGAVSFLWLHIGNCPIMSPPCIQGSAYKGDNYKQYS